MSSASKKGRLAENLAAEYLASLGFSIIKRNARLGGGELDIIAQENDTLAFVEVKAGQQRSMEQCLEAIDQRKQERICLAAQAYLAKHQLQTNCRFDVIVVDLSDQEPVCHLWRDAFRP